MYVCVLMCTHMSGASVRSCARVCVCVFVHEGDCVCTACKYVYATVD